MLIKPDSRFNFDVYHIIAECVERLYARTSSSESGGARLVPVDITMSRLTDRVVAWQRQHALDTAEYRLARIFMNMKNNALLNADSQ